MGSVIRDVTPLRFYNVNALLSIKQKNELLERLRLLDSLLELDSLSAVMSRVKYQPVKSRSDWGYVKIVCEMTANDAITLLEQAEAYQAKFDGCSDDRSEATDVSKPAALAVHDTPIETSPDMGDWS